MKTFLPICLLIISSHTLQAQRYIGVGISNYSAINSLYLNPASIADNADRFTLDLLAVNAAADNSILGINTKYAYHAFFSQVSANSNDLFVEKRHQLLNVMGPYVEMRLPGFTWNFNHIHGIAITSRVRMFNQFQGIDNSVFESIVNPQGTSAEQVANAKVTEGYKVASTVWSEIALTDAGVVYNRDGHKVKYGFTVRYLNGISYATATSVEDTTWYVPHQVFAVNENTLVATNLFGKLLEYPGRDLGEVINWALGGNGGHGYSGDFGLMYEYLPNDDYVYKLRISAAVTDIGAITYNINSKSALYKQTGTAERDSNNEWVKASGYPLPGVVVTQIPKPSNVMHLPGAVVVHADYNVYNDFFASLMFIGNITPRNENSTAYYSQITATPFYDTKPITLSMPISFNTLSKQLKIGVGFRAGKLYAGSDDILLFFMKGQFGANFYLGGSVSLDVKMRGPNIHVNPIHLKHKRRQKSCRDCEPVMMFWGK